jgi:hypothetical protein
MRNSCFLIICLYWFVACTSGQKENEKKDPVVAQTSVPEKAKRNAPEAGAAVTEIDSVPNQLIVPGKRIGKINLNEDLEVIQKILGKPSTANSGMGKSLQTWITKTADGKTQQISIFFSRHMGNEDEKSRAKQIRVTVAAFISEKNEAATTSILRGNISEAKKMAAYLLPNSKEQISIYDNIKTGIAFEFDPPGNVIAITVHEPGKPAFEIFSEVSSDLKMMKPSEQTTLPFPGIKD